MAELVVAGVVVAESVGVSVEVHQRNAKLQLTVVLADAEPVAGLYGRVEYRRHRVRPPVERPNGV